MAGLLAGLLHPLRRRNLGIASAKKPINVWAVSLNLESIGIIAGNRSLPLLFARQARAAGAKRIVAVAFEGETDPTLSALVDELKRITNSLKELISLQAV